MRDYEKSKKITLNGDIFLCDGWDTAGYLNSMGVSIERVISKNGKENGGYLLRFRHAEKGESGKRTYMTQEQYNKIKDKYDPYNEMGTWTVPLLNYIDR